jgi:hypothetical protein
MSGDFYFCLIYPKMVNFSILLIEEVFQKFGGWPIIYKLRYARGEGST